MIHDVIDVHIFYLPLFMMRLFLFGMLLFVLLSFSYVVLFTVFCRFFTEPDHGDQAEPVWS